MVKSFIVIVGLAFAALGTMKLFGARAITGPLVAMRVPRWGRLAIGALEVILGCLLAVSAFQPFFTFFVCALLLVVCLAAFMAHMLRGPTTGWPFPVVLGLAVIIAAGLQPLGLRVLALPKADVLPVRAAVARIVKTYRPNDAFEGVSIRADGTIFLTRNIGIDLQTGDSSNAIGEVVSRTPDGRESVLFRLPKGTTAGNIAFARDRSLVITAGGEQRGIWRIAGNGSARRVAPAPEGAWLNGITTGPDGKFYVADSSLGTIWRLDEQAGKLIPALRSALLAARPFIALAPGANGVRFVKQMMYVTVSDRGTIVRSELRPDGTLTEPSIWARGVPGDDFAVGEEGGLYVTTHPYNTVVHIAPDGTRTVIAGASQGVSGAVSAAFGVTPNDRHMLYVATDGGAFGGVANARGALVRLEPAKP